MKKIISIVLLFLIITESFVTVFALSNYNVEEIINNTASNLVEAVENPQVSSVGGEWAVLGLARSGLDINDAYFEKYYENAEKCIKENNGILHNKKYTEYSRVILALTSIGKNPTDVGGYNLLKPLGDFEKTVRQGINGAIWALIALDSKNYDIPINTDANVQATRELYINYILENQTLDGGWALNGDIADPDVTGMALQALSKYRDNRVVKTATDKALECLSKMQKENGGFSSYETENSESSVQVLVALCELGIPIDDERFVKNGNTVLDHILSFYCNNGFKHIKDDEINQMATEQCFYALVAFERMNKNENSLYDMRDVSSTTGSVTPGLSNKNPAVQKIDIIAENKTFSDISDHKNKIIIEDLASRGIINGKSEKIFEPYATMTRAEFATIITKGLGLPEKNNACFTDVTENHWFYSFVNTAYSYGIIKGVSESEFNPNGIITREEAAVMVARAAKLCGMDTGMESVAVRDTLSQFLDYVTASDWSKESLAFCYSENILDDSVMDIKPKEAVTRADIAYMLYNMLFSAKLL